MPVLFIDILPTACSLQRQDKYGW